MKHPFEEIREKYGLTRKEMAAVMETSYPVYNAYVNGSAFPGKKKLKLVADFFGIDLKELTEWMEQYKRYIINERKLKALEKVKPSTVYNA